MYHKCVLIACRRFPVHCSTSLAELPLCLKLGLGCVGVHVDSWFHVLQIALYMYHGVTV